MTLITIKIPEELLNEADEFAEDQFISRSALIRMALKYYLGKVRCF